MFMHLDLILDKLIKIRCHLNRNRYNFNDQMLYLIISIVKLRSGGLIIIFSQ